MTSTKCPKCGTDMYPKKPCPECGHEIGAPKESEDGNKPPKIEEEDLLQDREALLERIRFNDSSFLNVLITS